MSFDLKLDNKSDKNSEKLKEVELKLKQEPTWHEVWRNIKNKKNSESDLKKLKEVKDAIDIGELSTGVTSLKKFSKAHALRLYRQLKEQRKDQYIEQMLNNMPKNYVLITNKLDLSTLRVLLSYETEIALDTETTGLEFDDRICGISMTLPKVDKHYYIPVRHAVVNQLEPEFVFETLKPVFESHRVQKILHNAKFDYHMLLKEGIDLKGISMDTMIAMHVLNENEPTYALKALATKYGKSFGVEEDKSWSYDELFGQTGFQTTSLDIATYYACKDTHLTMMLANWIRAFFNNKPNLKKAYSIENKTLEVAIALEREGVLIDLNYAEKYKNQLTNNLDQIEKEIKTHLNIENINSNQQLLKAFKQKGYIQQTETSLDKRTLKALNNPLATKLLDYRKNSKLLTTYIEPLPKKIRSTGRLHGQFNQTSTVTSRFASNKPNLQNLCEVARGMIVPKEGYMLVEIDYSQIEPRYLAHISGDKDFQAPYLNNQDLYSTLASKTFNKPIGECGDGSKYRKQMKMGLLATMYGISSKQLAESLNIPKETAKQFLKDFLTAYPVTAKWMEKTKLQALTTGYVNIFGGRKRRFIGIADEYAKFNFLKNKICVENNVKTIDNIFNLKCKSKDKFTYIDLYKKINRVKRQAVNAVIQGSSATIMKLAMIEVFKQLKSNEKMVLVIHDALVIEMPLKTDLNRLQSICNCMTSVVDLEVPLKVDVEISKERWNKKESIEEFFKN